MSPFKFFLLGIFFCGCRSKQVAAPEGMLYVPATDVTNGFFIDRTPVTVAQFAAFVKATGYRTEAERFGNSGVFNASTGSWDMIPNANWKYPMGNNDSVAKNNHPVTQVSWNDAQAYCKWAGKRLPTIKEFELAAKGGNAIYNHQYPWGDSIVSCGKYQVNSWQGSFPEVNTLADGFSYTSPVGQFGTNSIGLADMGGNVWQWVQDWHPEKPTEKAQCGGSFLCDPQVCHGFKIGRLSSSTPETSLMHVGFRCVKDVR